jgi:hypothetical protein
MLRRALPGAARALRGAAGGAAPGAALPPAALACAARTLAHASAPCASPRNAVEAEPYNRARSLMPLGNTWPAVAPDAWVAPNATVVGNVTLDDQVSVWYGAVVRGDLARIHVGAFSNVQDRVVLGTARCAACRPRRCAAVAPRHAARARACNPSAAPPSRSARALHLCGLRRTLALTGARARGAGACPRA